MSIWQLNGKNTQQVSDTNKANEIFQQPDIAKLLILF